MPSPVWVSQRQADVPDGDDWLGERERAVLAGLRIAPRRDSWLLGRWTVKRVLSAWLGIDASVIEVLAGSDGAPEAWLDGTRVPASVSLSHRAGRALAIVADAPAAVGCDIELLERRSDAFVREWLSPVEQRFVSGCGRSCGSEALAANLVWTAKEAAAKVRHAGLRLDVRSAAVVVGGELERVGVWQAIEVGWGDGHGTTSGWWRAEPDWVMTVAAEPAVGVPEEAVLSSR